MKKLITIVTFLTLIGCVNSASQLEGAYYGPFSLVDVRLGMAESQVIEMFGDITDSGPVYRVVMRVSGNKKLFCYDTLRALEGAAVTGFRFENGELVEFFQILGDASMCNTSTAID